MKFSSVGVFLLALTIISFSCKEEKKKEDKKISDFQIPNGKFVLVNNKKLWIETSGNGQPLFLIAGGPGYSHNGMHSFDGLSSFAKLIYIDNFGRGKSDTAIDPKEYSIERDVEDIEAIRNSLGLDKINLLGHSYGSLVAQLYALKYSEHVSHLIIVSGLYNSKMWQENNDNCNYIFSRQYPELWDSLMILRSHGSVSSDLDHMKIYEQFSQTLLDAYCPDNSFGAEKNYPNDFNEKVYYQIVGRDGDFVVGNDVAKYDVTNQLKDLKMPILILAGRYDRMLPPKFSVEYKKYCPQAEFVMFERSGHNPQIEEKTDFCAGVLSFLSR